jgi:hypothetical protein
MSPTLSQHRVLHQIHHDRVAVGRWGLLGVLRASRNMAPIRMIRALGHGDVAVVLSELFATPKSYHSSRNTLWVVSHSFLYSIPLLNSLTSSPTRRQFVVPMH